MHRMLLSFTLLVAAAPLAAQTSPVPRVGTPAISTEASQRLRYEAHLPIRTAELREVGLADTTIASILSIFRARNVEPAAVDEILIAERDAARAQGPTDNFGAFVQRQLAAGKRGKVLADAIHAEHKAHGRRRGQGQDKPNEPRGQGQSGNDRRPN